MVMSLLESLYKSLYKNVKDSALSIFRSPWRPEKSCVFAATVLDPIAVSWRARPRDPLSCPYRTRPAAGALFLTPTLPLIEHGPIQEEQGEE